MSLSSRFFRRFAPLVSAAMVCVWPITAGAQTTRVSVTSTGVEANGASDAVTISSDGRYVAFLSTASNLVTGDTNNVADVFVKDRQTGAVERVSVTTAGVQADAPSSAPRISRDGRFVVFTTAAALVADDTNVCPLTSGGQFVPCPDVYIHDRQTHETTRVSVGPGTAQGGRQSLTADLSTDGRYVAFATEADLPTSNAYVDANQMADVYVRDRQAQTTRLVSHVAVGGGAGNGASIDPRISADGQTVLFRSTATNIAPEINADTICSEGGGPCLNAYIATWATEQVRRLDLIDLLLPPLVGRYDVRSATLSADGRTVALTVQTTFGSLGPIQTRYLWDIDEVRRTLGAGGEMPPEVALDDAVRLEVSCPSSPFAASVNDLTLALGDRLASGCSSAAIAGPRFVAFASEDATAVAGDTNAASDIFVLDRDPDADGMPSAWERAFVFDPFANDANGDADSDGVSNVAEYAAGTHPRGAYARYLAEGAANDFFTTYIDIFNPSASAANVVLRILGDDGRETSLPMAIGPKGRVTTLPSFTALSSKSYERFASGDLWLTSATAHSPTLSFSAVVEADLPVAVERSMVWGRSSESEIGFWYGSHAETGVAAPQTTWYFAEGATAGAFDLYYLLTNPGDAPASVTITYLRRAPLTPVVVTYTVNPHSRRTILVDAEPGLEAQEVSARIESDRAILAERAMYLSRPGEPYAGGSAGAALPAPALEWFIPEGATGSFFDLYVLVGNPGNSQAQLQVTYLLPDGTSFTKPYDVDAQSRLSISVKGEDARLAATAVSVVVTSTNNVPVVVERAMWWPSGDWYEGHASAGTTATSPRWALARGAINTYPWHPGTGAYILIANPSSNMANVTLDLSDRENLLCQRTIQVAAHSRATFDLRACATAWLGGSGAAELGGTITSDGPGIVVERSTYSSSPSRLWTAGESTILTRLP